MGGSIIGDPVGAIRNGGEWMGIRSLLGYTYSSPRHKKAEEIDELCTVLPECTSHCIQQTTPSAIHSYGSRQCGVSNG